MHGGDRQHQRGVRFAVASVYEGTSGIESSAGPAEGEKEEAGHMEALGGWGKREKESVRRRTTAAEMSVCEVLWIQDGVLYAQKTRDVQIWRQRSGMFLVFREIWCAKK